MKEKVRETWCCSNDSWLNVVLKDGRASERVGQECRRKGERWWVHLQYLESGLRLSQRSTPEAESWGPTNSQRSVELTFPSADTTVILFFSFPLWICALSHRTVPFGLTTLKLT